MQYLSSLTPQDPIDYDLMATLLDDMARQPGSSGHPRLRQPDSLPLPLGRTLQRRSEQLPLAAAPGALAPRWEAEWPFAQPATQPAAVAPAPAAAQPQPQQVAAAALQAMARRAASKRFRDDGESQQQQPGGRQELAPPLVQEGFRDWPAGAPAKRGKGEAGAGAGGGLAGAFAAVAEE